VKAGLPVGSRVRSVLPALLSIILSGVTCCGCAGPPMREYVLDAPPASTTASVIQTALPIIKIERVRLPDYLDSVDILTRRGGLVVPSRTGRWAERFSVGVTRALTTFLANRLTSVVVTSGQPIEPPVLRVLVDVIAFESTTNGEVLLAARWTITDGTGQKSLAAEQATLTEPIAAARDDSSTVAAMSRAVQNLANRIAAAVDHNLPARIRIR
jgi:uncharacterized protein